MLLPKVSVIIPFVKDRGWLKEAEQSVYNQIYQGEIELIISQSKGNVAKNINDGIEIATGEYIKYLSDDDRLTANSLEDSVKGIKGFDFIHGNAINFWDGGRTEIYRPPVQFPTLERLAQSCIIHGGSLMYRKDVFDRFGMFDETLDCAEEYDLNMRLLSKGCKLGYVDKSLYFYRRHDEQKSLGKKVDQVARIKRIEAIQNRYASKNP